MNSSAVIQVKNSKLLDSKTLLKLDKALINEETHVAEILGALAEKLANSRKGDFSYTVTNYVYIPSFILDKRKMGLEELTKEIGKHSFFMGSKFTPTVLRLTAPPDMTNRELFKAVINNVPTIAKHQTTDTVNHWTLAYIDDSIQMVFCGRSFGEENDK